MQERLQRFINDKHLFRHGQNLVLAVSGGPDSVVMAHLLHKLQFPISIAHCNFQLRSSESDADQVFTEKLAQNLGVPFFTINFNTKIFASKQKIGTQEAARVLRYQWLTELANAQNALICTAHHQSDHLETVLINWSRGSGWKGVRGIPLQRENIVRPLMCFGSDEIRTFAKENKVAFRVDSTNLKNDYLRNAIRHEVIPSWKKLVNDIELKNVKNAELISSQIDNYNFFLEAFKSTALVAENDAIKIPISSIKRFPHPAILLYDLLNDFNFNKDQCAQIMVDIDGHSGAVYQSSSHTLIRDRESLILFQLHSMDALVMKGVGTYNWNGDKISIVEKEKEDVLFDDNKDAIWIDADRVQFPIMVRQWQTGDKLQPMGMEGHKLVSDIFIDHRSSHIAKLRTPIVADDKAIIWVAGIRQSENHKIKESTESVYQIRWERNTF